MNMYSIFVVGCGATGSALVQNLSQFAKYEKKIKRIILIDNDVVEVKNFKNQKYFVNDMDKNKARVLASRYKKLEIDISYYEERILDSKRLLEMVNDNIKNGEIPILVSCVDNNKARKVFHEFFYMKDIKDLIYIDTGNGDGNHRYGQTVCGAKKDNMVISKTVGDLYPEIFEEAKVIEDKPDYTCSNVIDHPQSLATNIMSSTIVFAMINNIVSLEKIGRSVVNFNTDLIAIN